MFIRQPVRCTLELLATNWLRLEQRWEDNPGFVAAAAAGSLGLLLTAAMLVNAGLDWLQETPTGDEIALESSNFVDPELGDSRSDEILVMRGRKLVARGRNEDTNRYRAADDDSGDTSDPLAESRRRTRPVIGRSDEDFADVDSDDSTETALPTRIAKVNIAPQRQNSFDDGDESTEEITDRSTEESDVAGQLRVGTLPVQRPDAFDDNKEESAPEESAAKRPLAEMRVASQPLVLQPLEMDDEEESAMTDTDQPVGTDSKSPLPEPARLKPASQPSIANADSNLVKPVENDDRVDDDRLERNRSIDLVRAPAGRAVPEKDFRWKQQRTKDVFESAAPAIAARQSRPVETKIFAAPKARSVPVVNETRTPRERSAAPPLRLAISGPPSVGIGQPCHFEIRVTNTGSVPAYRLVVSAELPEGLVHDVAQSLEQQIDTLAPGATYRARLRLRGAAAGEKTIRAEVGTVDQTALQLSANVQVTSTTSTVAEECVVPVD